jgi:hypothetical protein
MGSSDKPLPQFSEYLFWDIDKSKLDYDRDAKYVVPRICSLGSLNDWKELKKYYGDPVIRDIVLNEKYLDNVTLNLGVTNSNG